LNQHQAAVNVLTCPCVDEAVKPPRNLTGMVGNTEKITQFPRAPQFFLIINTDYWLRTRGQQVSGFVNPKRQVKTQAKPPPNVAAADA